MVFGLVWGGWFRKELEKGAPEHALTEESITVLGLGCRRSSKKGSEIALFELDLMFIEEAVMSYCCGGGGG